MPASQHFRLIASGSSNQKCFPYQMFKKNHICKWIFFAISSFVKIDEITSAREKTGELEKEESLNLFNGFF